MAYCRHLVRIGAMGHVGRFDAVDNLRYDRSDRVICRTERGLEVGHVLAMAAGHGGSDGELLRKVTIEDELLISRLEKRQSAAFRACADLITQRQLPAVLMDVEHLFDGQSIFFYFLGEVSPEVEAMTVELAEAYETEVQFRKFTETLTEGCGPDCGTDAATGCGTGGCPSCAMASACSTRR